MSKLMQMDYLRAGQWKISRKMMVSLAESPVASVRRRVAENPKTPREILCNLAKDLDPEVRIAAAQNNGLPRKKLMEMIEDECDDVRYALAADPLIPTDSLMRLTEDANPYVACRAAATLQNLAAAAGFAAGCSSFKISA